MYYVIFFMCMLYLFVGAVRLFPAERPAGRVFRRYVSSAIQTGWEFFASQQPVKCSGADIMRINCGKEGMYV